MRITRDDVFTDELHYVDLDVFDVGNCSGKVWKLERYDAEGHLDSVEYEIELSVSDGLRSVIVPQHEIPDLLDAVRQATDCIRERNESLSAPSR